MVQWLLFLQLVVPTTLLLALIVAPARGRAVWSAGFAATTAVLILLALTGLWLVPPAWTLLVYLVGWAVAAWLGVRRRTARTARPRSRGHWVFVVSATALTLYSAREALLAWRGHQQPAGAVMELAFPLREGRYLILNGGDDVRINAHLKSRATSVPRFARWRGNGYAVDIVALDRMGMRASGVRPGANTDYEIFGHEVIAPCAGVVVDVVDGLADMTPPQHDPEGRLAGNHVILGCDGHHVLLAHLREGSIHVHRGERVAESQSLAQVGNSGGSDEAHLHIHVQRPGSVAAPFSGAPVPATFQGRFLVRGQAVIVAPDGALRVSPAALSWLQRSAADLQRERTSGAER